ncbi:hypothetical protein D3C85_1743250 [compost metagenome]
MGDKEEGKSHIHRQDRGKQQQDSTAEDKSGQVIAKQAICLYAPLVLKGQKNKHHGEDIHGKSR